MRKAMLGEGAAARTPSPATRETQGADGFHFFQHLQIEGKQLEGRELAFYPVPYCVLPRTVPCTFGARD